MRARDLAKIGFFSGQGSSGGSGGGGKLYHHSVIISDTTTELNVPVKFYSSSAKPVTTAAEIPFDRIICPIYMEWGYYPYDPECMINGGSPFMIVDIYNKYGTRIDFRFVDGSLTGMPIEMEEYTITDTVKEV